MKPHGALSKNKLLALVKPGQSIYKIYGDGNIHKATCTGRINGKEKLIMTVDDTDVCHLKNWFGKNRQTLIYKYIFDNYFHALAYSLKLKADHGKAQSKERTGVEGAA